MNILFADLPQDENLTLSFPEPVSVARIFVETAIKEPVRVPQKIEVWLSSNRTDWQLVASRPTVTQDLNILSFSAPPVRYIRLDFGHNQGPGSRLIKVGAIRALPGCR